MIIKSKFDGLSKDTLECELKNQLCEKLPIFFDTNFFDPILIQTDSRTVKSREWFIALKGENFDAHDFIPEVIDLGVKGFILDYKTKEKWGSLLKEKDVIWVKNPETAYQDFARAWRRHLANSSTFIGLTGSSGKSTVRHLTSFLLRQHASTHEPSKNHNNEIGVPITICATRPDHRFIVLELAARHLGDITLLAKMSEPDVVGCLNVGQAHIQEFGGMDNTYKAKLEIFSSAKSGARIVANADDSRILAAAQEQKVTNGGFVHSFGFAPSATVRVMNVGTESNKAWMVLRFDTMDEMKLPLPFPHLAMATNIAAASALALAAGLSFEELEESLSLIHEFVPIEGRFVSHRLSNNIMLIDDAYNANPDSLTLGLKSLKTFSQGFSKRILILGDMLELGSYAKESHGKIGQLIAELNPEYFVAVGEESKEMVDQAVKNGFPVARLKWFQSCDELLSEESILKSILRPSHLIYVKASRGIRLDKLVSFIRENDNNLSQ